MREISDSGQSAVDAQPATFRIIVTGCIVGSIFLILSFILLNQYMEEIQKQRTRNLSQMVQIARNAIEPILSQYRTGDLSRKETIEGVRNLVREMQYQDHSGKNYIFMSDYDGTMLVQPFEPEKEMTNQWDLQDVNGIYIIRGLVETARRDKNGGLFSYNYHPPESAVPERKISFVMGIPELECYLGTGKYLGDISKIQDSYLIKILMLDAVFIILLFFLVRDSILGIQSQNRILLSETQLRKSIEIELRKHRDNLEEIVGERTAELKQEITYRKDAESRLKTSEKRLDAIIKTVPDIIYRLDPQGRITFISDAVRLYGYTPETLLGREVIELVYGPDREKAVDKLKERRTRQRRTQSFEVRLLTRDDEHIPFEIFSVSAEGLYSSDSPNRKDFIGTQGIARDITERKRAEREREKLIIELQDALENVKTLSGLVPICSQCKSIRDDRGYWKKLEEYMHTHAAVKFSHSLCNNCADELYGEESWYKNIHSKRER